MNGHTAYLWFALCCEAMADISSPRPYFEQQQLPPPDLPPYLFPWPSMWLIAPILVIGFVLLIRVRIQKKVEKTSLNNRKNYSEEKTNGS